MIDIAVDTDGLMKFAQRLATEFPRRSRAGVARALNSVGGNLVDQAVAAYVDQYDLEPDVVRGMIEVNKATADDPTWSMNAGALGVLSLDQMETRGFAERQPLPTRRGPSDLDLVRIVTMEDETVCQICKDAADDSPYTLEDVQAIQAKWINYVPPYPVTGVRSNLVHPNAVLEGSRFASYGLVRELVSAAYRGPAIRLTTNVGVVTIGPNHPMLTRRGFVAANKITEGDDLLYDSRSEHAVPMRALKASTLKSASAKPHLDKVPAFEDVFSAASVACGQSHVFASSNDLHGDAVFCENEVNTVRPAGFLLPVLDPLGIEQFSKAGLMRSDVELFIESGLGSFCSFHERAFAALNRLMRRRNLSLALCGAHAAPLDQFLLRSGTKSHRGLLEHPVYYRAADTEPPSYRIDALSRLVERNDRFWWKRVSGRHVVPFSGMAFDASTMSGLYSNDGFVVKNCRCAIQPWRSMRKLPVQFVGAAKAPRELLTMRQLGQAVAGELNITLRAISEA